MENGNAWIEKLDLRPHPEGGFFKETYRSSEIIPGSALPERFEGDRVFSTGIYFLLPGGDFSAFHRIKQDELWHFYDGASLTIHEIDKGGVYSAVKLGRDILNGEYPQATIRAGSFFAASVNDPESFSLIGCTVAPGFDFTDFELPFRNELSGLFPQHREIIEKYTRAKHE
jgi:hypothetical protein